MLLMEKTYKKRTYDREDLVYHSNVSSDRFITKFNDINREPIEETKKKSRANPINHQVNDEFITLKKLFDKT